MTFLNKHKVKLDSFWSPNKMVGFFDLSLNTSNLKEKVISKFFKNSCIKLYASLKSDNSWCETFKFFHRNRIKAFKSPYNLYRKISKIHQKKNNEEMMLNFWKLNECNIRKKEYTTKINFRSYLYFLWMSNAIHLRGFVSRKL